MMQLPELFVKELSAMLIQDHFGLNKVDDDAGKALIKVYLMLADLQFGRAAEDFSRSTIGMSTYLLDLYRMQLPLKSFAATTPSSVLAKEASAAIARLNTIAVYGKVPDPNRVFIKEYCDRVVEHPKHFQPATNEAGVQINDFVGFCRELMKI